MGIQGASFPHSLLRTSQKTFRAKTCAGGGKGKGGGKGLLPVLSRNVA